MKFEHDLTHCGSLEEKTLLDHVISPGIVVITNTSLYYELHSFTLDVYDVPITEKPLV